MLEVDSKELQNKLNDSNFEDMKLMSLLLSYYKNLRLPSHWCDLSPEEGGLKIGITNVIISSALESSYKNILNKWQNKK